MSYWTYVDTYSVACLGDLILSIVEPIGGDKTVQPLINVLVCIRRYAITREPQIEVIAV